MAAPFGFSAGDFVAGVGLVKDIIESLKDSVGASATYQALITELYTFQYALLLIRQLRLEDSANARPAIVQAISNFQTTISRFLEKNKKFAPYLRAGGSTSKWRDTLRKVQWSIFREEDVQTLKSELTMQISAINTSLSIHNAYDSFLSYFVLNKLWCIP